MGTGGRTTATGGSAASQADSLDQAQWTPRPGLSVVVKATIIGVPLLAGVAAVMVMGRIVSRPADRLGFWLWMGALVVVSLVASMAAERVTRRLAPLGALFKMSLVFPDRAPSRFRTAIRAGGTRTLARDLEAKGVTSPEQAAAEQLLVMMARMNSHDRLTRGHSERVRAYSVMLGEQMRLSRDDLDKLNWAALVHDIGKIKVPEQILNKPGRPTDAEWAVLRDHPEAAHHLVEPLRPWLGEWVDAATQHHERFDGGGYPRGLSGHEITLAGRLVAIADAYDVMTAARSYKKPLPPQQARAELLRNAGTQFDPALVRHFLEISLGRRRWFLGGVGLFSRLPELIQAPLTTVGSASTGLVAAGSVTLAAAAGLVAPAADEPPTAVELVTAERILDEPADPEPGPSTSAPSPSPTDGPAAPPTTTTAPGSTTTVPVTSSTVPASTTIPTSTTTTVAIPDPTSTLPAPTTTTTTTSTTTTTTTTTTTLPPLASQWLLGSGGATTSEIYLPLDGTLTGGALPNYDTNHDDDDGLLVVVGTGLDETDPDRMQYWWGQLDGATHAVGSPTLRLWAAVKDFDTNATGQIDAGIYDCAANKTDCVLLSSGVAGFDQSDHGSDFGLVVVAMPPIDHAFAPNRGLLLKVAVPVGSDGDLWLAYGTTTYPTALTIE